VERDLTTSAGVRLSSRRSLADEGQEVVGSATGIPLGNSNTSHKSKMAGLIPAFFVDKTESTLSPKKWTDFLPAKKASLKPEKPFFMRSI